MSSTSAKSHKLRRLESKKSHSWWWDSHVSPKNSKWLQENLQDMDQNVKRMLKLIEEDAESFAKRAEMYYQKRPELVKLVEEFYRMYRSLAERYDLVTGELRKNMPSDLRSQSSGISEGSYEPPSICTSPDRRPVRRRSGARAAGFEFFLGTGGTNSELGSREGDESSTLDSESESDESVVSDDQILNRKINELEVELRDVKEKLRTQQEDISECSSLGSKDSTYDEELRVVKEKLRLSKEEVNRLKIEMVKFESANVHGDTDEMEKDLDVEKKPVVQVQDGTIAMTTEGKILELEERLKRTKDVLSESEKELARLRQDLKKSRTSEQLLQDQLGIAKKDASSWKAKHGREEREVSKLQDRIMRYKSSLADRDQEIRRFKEAITNANKTLSEENSQLQAEITKMQKERSYLDANVRELDLRSQSLEEEVRRVLAGKLEMEASLGAEIDQLKTSISEGNNLVAELTQALDTIAQNHDMLLVERDGLNAKVEELLAEKSSKDERIAVMNQHLHQLHMEHVILMSKTEGAHKLVEELRSRIEELEEQIERQKELIQERAEEKREVIRQLCFSLEHYQDRFQHLREALIGHKRIPIKAR
ncbi:hypothetical protein Leryth_018646 [Lithospermum erythrorhizon]|nr:hypothetical protein Leryth_018646 [Lithospermum erythrorhizon]